MTYLYVCPVSICQLVYLSDVCVSATCNCKQYTTTIRHVKTERQKKISIKFFLLEKHMSTKTNTLKHANKHTYTHGHY